MTDIAIIGAGRLGTSLGFSLSRAGFKVKSLSCLTLREARESARIIGTAPQALADNAKAAARGEIVLLCLPDEEIPKVVRELSSSSVPWSNRTVLHCSGLLSSSVLFPLKKKGAVIGSLHPIQAVCRKSPLPGQFRNVFFGLEGEKKALNVAARIVKSLHGHALVLEQKDKPAYHAACVFASNFMVVILDAATSILQGIGFSAEQAGRTLFPLIEGTLQNVKEFGVGASLTGPIVRGDIATIKAHIKAIRSVPSLRRLYSALGAQALKIARKRGLPPGKIKALRKLLEDR